MKDLAVERYHRQSITLPNSRFADQLVSRNHVQFDFEQLSNRHMTKGALWFHLQCYQNTLTFISPGLHDDLYYIDSDICPSSPHFKQAKRKTNQPKALSIVVFPSLHSKLLPIRPSPRVSDRKKKSAKLSIVSAVAAAALLRDQWIKNFNAKWLFWFFISRNTRSRGYASCFRHRCKLPFETRPLANKKNVSRTAEMLRSFVLALL